MIVPFSKQLKDRLGKRDTTSKNNNIANDKPRRHVAQLLMPRMPVLTFVKPPVSGGQRKNKM